MKKILVIVDMQNDFTTGALGNKECKAVIPKIVDIINNEEFDEYILTKDTHTDNYLNTAEGKKLPIKHCIENTYGWEICEPIMKALNDKNKYHVTTVIDKTTFGSLYMANLLREKYFIEQKDVELTVVGVCTGICVISNVLLLKAAIPESKITVISDACACVTPESHKTALEAMKMCHIDVFAAARS